MKSPITQRDDSLNMSLDILSILADGKAHYTAQSFIERARANVRCGNFERAFEYAKIAKSYVAPERVTV